jgi:cardiolipin synthase (CMP-forming)
MFDKSRIPNILTWLRVFAVPAMVAAYLYWGELGMWIGGSLFIVASITDYFDGYLARKWGVQSSFGRLLDPIADKLLVAAALMLLVHAHRAPFLPALVIICREMLVSGLREFLAERRIPMPVSALAKIKTGVQMVAISFLLLAPVVDAMLWNIGLYGWLLGMQGCIPDAQSMCRMEFLVPIGMYGLWVAGALTLITGYHYWRAGVEHMR